MKGRVESNRPDEGYKRTLGKEVMKEMKGYWEAEGGERKERGKQLKKALNQKRRAIKIKEMRMRNQEDQEEGRE